MTPELRVVRVTAERVALVNPLLDAYRQFYRQASDPEGARRFLSERLARGESVVFAAVAGGDALGFTQLYPTFSSVSLRPVWILNDLFVTPPARRLGVGARLLTAAADFAGEAGAVRLELATAVENVAAQALYEKLGWRRDTAFARYKLELPRKVIP